MAFLRTERRLSVGHDMASPKMANVIMIRLPFDTLSTSADAWLHRAARGLPPVQSKESRRLCGATPFSLRLEVQRGSTILGFALCADADAILIAVALRPCVPRRDARSRPG